MNEIEAKSIGRKVILSSWLAVFVLFGCRTTFSILLVPMKTAMDWSVSQLSMGYSCMMAIYAVTAFFSGYIIDKWGTRPAYAIGAAFTALGFFITSACQSYLSYLIPYAVLVGVGTGMLWVSSTVSVRKWYVGKSYATAWGMAFMGAPMAQVLLSLGLKEALSTLDWRVAMQGLAVISFAALAVAAIAARRTPEYYGAKPFGEEAAKPGQTPEYEWAVGAAFKNWSVWGSIIAFMTCVLPEFLVWTQVVNFWTHDLNLSLGTATNMYAVIGVVGIFSMPLMGIVADKVVASVGDETKGRRIMLIFAPLIGVVACILLLYTDRSLLFGIVSCVLFAVYWAIEPGGIAGYVGSLYGRKTLGMIWGVCTLIVMGVGPFAGSLVGGYLFDVSGNYVNSLLFALGSFVVSALVAWSLPTYLIAPPAEAKKAPVSIAQF